MVGKGEQTARDVEGSAPRLLIVVARDRRDLYEYFQHGLAGIEENKVGLDRRNVPPGMPSGGTPDPDLRKRPDMSDELQQRGFAMIHLW